MPKYVVDVPDTQPLQQITIWAETPKAAAQYVAALLEQGDNDEHKAGEEA